MDIQNTNSSNGGLVSLSANQSTVTPPSSAASSVSQTPSSAPPSVDVSVEISPEAQQLAQDSQRLTTVSQTSETSPAVDSSNASQFGANSTANNASVAAEIGGSSGSYLNATPSNSSQSGSVTSQYNVSPDTALGQTINFSA